MMREARLFVDESLLELNVVLAEMFRTRQTIDESGAPTELRWETSKHFAEALYRTVTTLQPALSVEIGMACGVSTLAMLTGLQQVGDGHLISIDPYQSTEFRGAGRCAVKRAGLSERHQVIEKPSYLALPELVGAGHLLDFAYIDGWHTFDYVLLDFFYIDRMLRPGGMVAFNDCSFPAIHKVLLYMAAHRRYEEVDVGLHATPAWES